MSWLQLKLESANQNCPHHFLSQTIPMSPSQGAQAEQLAAQFLQQRGLKLITQNYRCRVGEIDLVMQHAETLVFVEVRMRGNALFGGARASIDQHKQAKLIRTAQHYLATLAHTPPCRFDAVLMQDANGRGIEWVQDAFGA